MNKGLASLINRVNEPRGHWIEKAIINFHRSRQRPRKYTGFFNPSSCHQEARPLYLDFAGLTKRTADDAGFDYMESGNWCHKQYQTYFQDLGFALAIELPIRIGPPEIVVPISGRTDAILLDPNKEEYLVDIKGTNSSKISTIKHPEIETLTQWVLYSWIFGVKKGGVMYVNRSIAPPPVRKIFDLENDAGSVNIFLNGQQVHRENCLLQNTIQRMLTVYNMYAAQKVPPRCAKCHLGCESRQVCDDLDGIAS